MTDAATLLALFSSAFLAATLLPGASEVTLVALIASGREDVWRLVIVATAGNTLGSVANWLCGRFLLRFQDRRWFPVPRRQIERASEVFRRYGMASLLLAWAPIGGDALTVIAGVLKAPLLPFTLLVGTGKFLRYVVVAGATLAWPFT